MDETQDETDTAQAVKAMALIPYTLRKYNSMHIKETSAMGRSTTSRS